MSKILFDFTGENYVVTGASSGMGLQVARDLAEGGAMVLAIARNGEKLAELKSAYPEQIIIAVADVCDYDGVGKAIDDFVRSHGKINGAVHAAGITDITPLRVYDEAAARRIMDVSFWAGVKLIQCCAKAKNSNPGAAFLLFSSVCSQRTDKGLFAYAGAKAAVQTAVRSFAKELANRRLRINTVSPGWVQTGMTDGLEETHNLDEVYANSILGVGKAPDVSSVVLFLLSDGARWITGTNVVVDGGFLA